MRALCGLHFGNCRGCNCAAFRTPLMLFTSADIRSGHATERRAKNLWQAGVKMNPDNRQEKYF
jgi:hypothetical protein